MNNIDGNYNANSENLQYLVRNPMEQPYYQYATATNNAQFNNNFQMQNTGELYTNPQQTYHKPQSSSSYQENLDFLNWDHRLVDFEKCKIPDKIDVLEIGSKDLSPSSFCSTVEQEGFKSNKEFYQNQWFYNGGYNQKQYEYPSCAQFNSGNKTYQYCSIQKSQELNSMEKSCLYSDKNDGSSLRFKSQEFGYSLYEDSNFFPQRNFLQEINVVGQQTEESNGESDIIVEESDGEITDYSEPERSCNKCLICNTIYTAQGRQFYYLTLESPLTMSSQKPVYYKIIELVGNFPDKRNYLCSECLGLINTIDHLQLKLNSFTNELLLKFGKPISSSQTHIVQKKKTKRTKKYKCKICKKIISLKAICENHLKRHKAKGVLCEFCGKIFKNRQKFIKHKTKHKLLTKKIDAFKCSNCPKFFRTKSNLKEHQNYCLNLLPHCCKSCDKKFPSSTKLKNHVKLKHEKKFVAICSICNTGFVKMSDYKSHKITHSIDKKFQCEKCNKSYKTLSNLNFHKKMHEKKLPFICKICEKGFMRKEYLEAHVNNHNGVKNYSCTFCEKKFVSQKNLDSHLKSHDLTVKL